MKSPIFKLGILVSLFVAVNVCELLAQNNNEEFSRLSLLLNGGATIGNGGSGFKFFRSSMSIENKTTPSFGASIQYALTPTWTVEGGYKYTRAEALNNSFETDVNTIIIRNVLNLNQLLKLNKITSSFNPFLSAGLGLDIFDFESSQESFSDVDASFSIGAGLYYNLTERLDLFSQYEYQFSTNLLDNKPTGFGSDVLGTVTGGVRINFGKKGKKHLSWSPPAFEIPEEEYKELVAASNRLRKLESDYQNLQNEFSRKEQELLIGQRESDRKIAGLRANVDSLENYVAGLKAENDSLKKVNERLEKNCGQTTELQPGHYIQIFAAAELANAMNVRRDAISRLTDRLSSPSTQVFITSRRSYYEVLIGVFKQMSETDDILEKMIQVHRDAFVKTIPRPPHLYEAYKDLKRVNLDEN